MLPEVHGFEICRQLKTSERFRHIPVIMISGVHTGWRFAADVKEKYGADDYLEKPFETADLLRRVRGAAQPHRRRGLPRLRGRGPPAPQGRRDRPQAGHGSTTPWPPSSAASAIDQFNDLLHYYLAMTYEKKDMVFHAIDHYEKAIQINPDFYDAITSLANLYQKQEFWRKAVEMWELALSATKDEAVRERIKDHLLSLL